MTDPHAALAVAMAEEGPDPSHVQRHLAERGVLLVTEAMLIQAIRIVISPTDAVEDGPAIFAALSDEATE